ncbi:MAG: nucleotide pyrophosphohydrolase [Deltaproteobacteria bacterium]|nr:nucleotide pyrophosphohydrolase [Deltaproteobacteria bacterium]
MSSQSNLATGTDRDTPLEALKAVVERFCTERDWDQFHDAKELSIGAATEAGELLALFRFQTGPDIENLLGDASSRRRVEEEMADVLFFILRLAQRYDIDLTSAFTRKLALNAVRYPVEKSRGKNRKYDEL